MNIALSLLVVCLIGGLGLVVTGVYAMFGIGPALILAGVVLLIVATVIYRGMTTDEK
jgi:hypothetical protein